MSRATSKIGDYSVHNEWQSTKRVDFKFKTVKKDRKKIAELRSIEGAKFFVIPKRAEDFVLSRGRVTIPRSMTMVMMCLGKPDIMVEVNNGDTYFMTYAEFETNRYTDKEGSIHYWYVDADKCLFTKGKAESIEEALMVGRWK